MPFDPTFDNCADFFPKGWLCPGCKTVHAPFVSTCDCQKPKTQVVKFHTMIANPFFTFVFEDSGEVPAFAL